MPLHWKHGNLEEPKYVHMLKLHLFLSGQQDNEHRISNSHQFDVWHVAKSVIKKLNAKGKSKKNADLLQWVQCFSKHFGGVVQLVKRIPMNCGK